MSADLQQRIRAPEIMDQPDLDPRRHENALRGLARLNRWSGSATALWSAIRRSASLQSRPLRILDVACGGGDVLIGIGQRARRACAAVELVGCDISPRAVQYATEHAASNGVCVEFIPLDATCDPLPAGFDCILSSLFLHHLDGDQAVALLRKMRAATLESIVVCDLVRNRRGLLLTEVFVRLLTRCDVVHTDGPRSVRAAFTITEARQLANEAGLDGAAITPCWPCRFLLTWKAPG